MKHLKSQPELARRIGACKTQEDLVALFDLLGSDAKVGLQKRWSRVSVVCVIRPRYTTED